MYKIKSHIKLHFSIFLLIFFFINCYSQKNIYIIPGISYDNAIIDSINYKDFISTLKKYKIRNKVTKYTSETRVISDKVIYYIDNKSNKINLIRFKRNSKGTTDKGIKIRQSTSKNIIKTYDNPDKIFHLSKNKTIFCYYEIGTFFILKNNILIEIYTYNPRNKNALNDFYLRINNYNFLGREKINNRYNLDYICR